MLRIISLNFENKVVSRKKRVKFSRNSQNKMLRINSLNYEKKVIVF